ncbi:MAG: hypothetical protein RL141_1142 [Candidatus Parcubacteria bacterium]|jgi:BASS family bile acid:Na+ symporter
MFSKVLDLLARYQLVLVGVALVLGLTKPEFFLPFSPWNSLLLQIIMFATGLRLNLTEFVHEAEDWRTLLLGNAMMLVGIPILVAIPLTLFAPEWILPFVIAAAMPTGLTAPAVVSILGGRTSLAILMSISTSLLSPFLVPVVIKILAGASVSVNTMEMMTNIAWVVIAPLALAAFIHWRMTQKQLRKIDAPLRLVNLVAFALVIASVTAGGTAVSSGNAGSQTFFGMGFDGIIIVLLMTIFWLGVAWLASAMLAWRKPADRVTLAFCLVYMNTTLAVWVADRFFHETNIAPKLVAIFIATTLILPVFKFFMPKERRGKIRGNVHAVEQV